MLFSMVKKSKLVLLKIENKKQILWYFLQQYLDTIDTIFKKKTTKKPVIPTTHLTSV